MHSSGLCLPYIGLCFININIIIYFIIIIKIIIIIIIKKITILIYFNYQGLLYIFRHLCEYFKNCYTQAHNSMLSIPTYRESTQLRFKATEVCFL